MILTFPSHARSDPLLQSQEKPLIGLWERINITVCMVWEIVLAIVLLRKVRTPGLQESP